ncbi:trigger factor, partial [Patescibacteria group bacterium]|nr:trigger factor [Patescibacteria group bacterium]
EETTKQLEKAAKEVSQMVKVPGFRPGQAPMEILKKHVRDGAIEGHMIDTALPETYTKAVKQENLEVISRPHVKILTDVPLKYEAIVAIYPEVKISGYDKVKIKPQDTKVEDKEVDEVLEDVRKRHAVYNKVDRPARHKDRLTIDFEGFDSGGAPLENTQSKGHPVILGENTLVPGFEDNLIGTKKGDEKEFTVTFPKDYFHEPFKGKKVTFKVAVHEVEEMQMPEMDAEFIKKIAGEEKPLEEVKTTIRKNLEEEKIHAEKVRRENRFLDKLADMVKVEIPDILVEEEIDGMLEEMQNGLSERGISMNQYLENTKKTIEDLRKQRRPEAEKRLKLRFALHQIFKQDKIEATEEDMKKEFDHIMALYPEGEKEKVEKEYKEGSYLRRRLENKICMEKLFAMHLSE